MPKFNRRDVAYAYYLLECDYNVGGCIVERKRTQDKVGRGAAYQVSRILGELPYWITYKNVNRNTRAIYRAFVKKHNLPK